MSAQPTAEQDAANGDLWTQLEQLDKAEPLPAEDDLILRMQAVSKVRKAQSRRDSSSKPSKGIGKKRKTRKHSGMQL
jgi:hypothetical protein